MIEDNGENLFEIDLSKLEVEWCRQPRLMLDACLKLADARQEADRAKAAVELSEAELSLSIRKVPADYGLDKVTEATVASMVIAIPSHHAAIEIHRKARHKVDVIQAYVSALEHKKKALENSVQLQMSGYFAAPREPAGSNINETARKGMFKKGKK